MDIKNQICTLEQAKKLKELGIVQNSYFCFIGDDNPDPKYNVPYQLYTDNEGRSEVGASWYEHRISAFTVSEFSLILRDKMPYWIGIWREWGFKNHSGKGLGFQYLATACGERLINLLENNLITVDEVNQQLSSE